MRASTVKRQRGIARRNVVTHVSPLMCFIVGTEPIRPLRVVEMSCIIASLSDTARRAPDASQETPSSLTFQARWRDLWMGATRASRLWTEPHALSPAIARIGLSSQGIRVSVTSTYSGAPRPQPKDHTMSENIEDLKARLARS